MNGNAGYGNQSLSRHNLKNSLFLSKFFGKMVGGPH